MHSPFSYEVWYPIYDSIPTDCKREFSRLNQISVFQNGLQEYGKKLCENVKIKLNYHILKDICIFNMNWHAYFIQITEIIFQSKHQDVLGRNMALLLHIEVMFCILSYIWQYFLPNLYIEFIIYAKIMRNQMHFLETSHCHCVGFHSRARNCSLSFRWNIPLVKDSFLTVIYLEKL